MGLFIKLMLFVVVAAVAALFFLKDPDGEPLLTVSDLKEPNKSVSGVIERLPEVKNPFAESPEQKPAEEAKPVGKTKIYSWRDEQGNVHFTDQPPEDKTEVKTIKVDPNRNVLPATKPPYNEDLGKEIAEKLTDLDLQLPEVNAQEGADQMMKDARESKDNMLQRKDAYDRVIDQ